MIEKVGLSGYTISVALGTEEPRRGLQYGCPSLTALFAVETKKRRKKKTAAAPKYPKSTLRICLCKAKQQAVAQTKQTQTETQTQRVPRLSPLPRAVHWDGVILVYG